MNWNILLLAIALLALVLFGGTALIQHLTEAEAIAEELGPEIGVNTAIVRQHLEAILKRGRLRRVIVYCTPWAVMSLLLALRMARDHREGNAFKRDRA